MKISMKDLKKNNRYDLSQEQKIAEVKRLWWDGVERKRQSLEEHGIPTNTLDHEERSYRWSNGIDSLLLGNNVKARPKKEKRACERCGDPTKKNLPFCDRCFGLLE